MLHLLNLSYVQIKITVDTKVVARDRNSPIISTHATDVDIQSGSMMWTITRKMNKNSTAV